MEVLRPPRARGSQRTSNGRPTDAQRTWDNSFKIFVFHTGLEARLDGTDGLVGPHGTYIDQVIEGDARSTASVRGGE